MSKNDIYEIKARVANIIAREDIALSPVGRILVNYFSLLFKDLYDLSETLPEERRQFMQYYLKERESLPMTIIKVATPKKEKTLYEQVMESRENPQFDSAEEALEHITKEYEELGAKHGKSGDDFWFEAEEADGMDWCEDYAIIMRLKRHLQMCHYLIEKNKNGLSSQED